MSDNVPLCEAAEHSETASLVSIVIPVYNVSVETLMKFALKYNADIVSARRCREFVGKTIYHTKKDEDAQIAHGDEILAFYGKGLLPDVVWNKLYLSECFSGIRFYDGHNYEDVSVTWKIMSRLAKTNGTAVVLPDSLYHFRMRKSSISHTESFRNIDDGWMAYHEKLTDKHNLPMPLP